MNKKPMFICIMGIDGVGKTTHAKMITKSLQNKGIKCKYKWLRYHHLLSLPLLAFCRVAGYTKVYTLGNNQKSSYHEFYRSNFVSNFYPWVLFMDMIFFTTAKVYIPMLLNKSIICDRFVYDTLIDIAISTNNREIFSTKVSKLFLKLIPKNAKFVMLNADQSIILSRRKELKDDLTFDERYKMYFDVSNKFGIQVVNNSRSIEEVNRGIISFLET